MRAALVLILCVGCFVRPGVYREERERLEDGDPMFPDCDDDGLGDPSAVGQLAPEDPPLCECLGCEGGWAPNALDCDDTDPDTGARLGTVCADQVGDPWWLGVIEGDEHLLIGPGDPWTARQARDRCGDRGWGGPEGSVAEVEGPRGDAILQFVRDAEVPWVGWIGASWDGAGWVWPTSGDPVSLPFCGDPVTPEDLFLPDADALLVLQIDATAACVGAPMDTGQPTQLSAPGFLCRRPAVN